MLKFFHSHKNAVIFVSLAFILGNIYYNLWSVRAIKDARLEEKYIEVKNGVDRIAKAVNASDQVYWELHEEHIITSVTDIDSLDQVYAAAYKFDGENLHLITTRIYDERDYENTEVLTPINYEEAGVIFNGQQSGRFEIGYTPSYQKWRKMLIYYRWMPSYSAPDEKYIVLAGVTEYSIQTQIPALHTFGMCVSTALVALLFFIFILLDTKLGYWWIERGKDCYRGENNPNDKH